MRSHSLVTGGAVFGLGTVAVAGGNFALSLILCRALGPLAFRMVASVATIILLLSTIAAGIQLQVAAGAGLPWIRRVRRGAVVLAGITAATSGPLGLAMSVSSDLLLVTAVGIPFHAELALRRGLQQRHLRFGWLTGSLLVELVVRAVLTALLVGLGTGALGAVAATNAAFGLTIVAMRTGAAMPQPDAAFGGAGDTPAGLWLMSVATAALTNGDVLLVGRLLPAGAAGRYAAVAVVARASFLVAVAIQNIVVPAILAHGRHVARTGLALTGISAIVSIAGMRVGGDLIVAFLLPDASPTEATRAVATMATLGAAGGVAGVASVAAATAATGGNRLPALVLCGTAAAHPAILAMAPATMTSIALTQLMVAALSVFGVAATMSLSRVPSLLGDRWPLPIGTS